LQSVYLVVHDSVSRVILHGSRGLKGEAGINSDIDLSLLVDFGAFSTRSDKAALLAEIAETTLGQWQGPVELDLATIFEARNCGLKCFDQEVWDAQFCKEGGVDCFGLYKTQRSYNGLVINAGVQVQLMYPCLIIWRQDNINMKAGAN
jgi:hypothetical protein